MFYFVEPKVYKPYSLEIKVTGVRQVKNCVWISYTLSHYVSTFCSFDNKEWKRCKILQKCICVKNLFVLCLFI